MVKTSRGIGLKYGGAAWDEPEMYRPKVELNTTRYLDPSEEASLVSRLIETAQRERCDACETGIRNHNHPERKRNLATSFSSNFLRSIAGKRLTGLVDKCQ